MIRNKSKQRLSMLSNWIGVYGIVIVLIIIGIIISDNFLTVRNFLNILDAVTFLGIVAVGMSFVTYSGQLADFSIPSTIALAGVVTVSVYEYGLYTAILAGIAAGLLIGIINGFVIGKFRANPIIWTLALNFVVLGLLKWLWGGRQLVPDFNATRAGQMFLNLSRIELFKGFSLPTLIMIILVIVGQFIFTKTTFGVQLKITGTSFSVAKMSGIKVSKVLMGTFILASLGAAICGILLASQAKTGAWWAGEGYAFRSITAVVIGGIALTGGQGNIIGVIGGALVIGLLSNIMTLLGVQTYAQDIIEGFIFILVVGVHSFSLRRIGLERGNV